MWKKIAILSLGCALLGAPGLAPAEAQETGAGGGPQFLIGPQAELDFVRGPNYPGDPSDSRAGLLLGIYAGTSGLELIPSILISEGQYKGFLVDAGLRITPKWFGQDEYLFNLVSPYAVLGGSLGYPWSVGWHVKAGLGVALMEFGSINAEIGYRSHRFDPNIQLDGVSIALRATYPF